MKAVVQISLDFTDLNEAFRTAEIALAAGVDWLEVGTPLIMAEGTRGVRELRARYPHVPLVADLKIMDGGYLEAQMMATAGANMIVVMGQAHAETIELVVKAGKDFGVEVMGDIMAMPDLIAGAQRLQDLGCHYIIHHIGYDMRTLRAQRGLPVPSPLDQLREIVEAVEIPVQAVGGLSIEQAVKSPSYGAPMVVIGAPLAVDAYSFQAAKGDLESILREICQQVHAYGDVDRIKETV